MRKLVPIVLSLFLLLYGCTAVPAQTQAETETAVAPADSDSGEKSEQEEYQRVMVAGTEILWDGYRAIEPEWNGDIATMTFADFGEDLFTGIYDVNVDSYSLMEGEITQTQVFHIRGKESGKCVYIVAGVHGDERAAWLAGILLRNATLRAGDLYVLAPANANGAANGTRYVTDSQDLNRSFPGNAAGNETQKLANAIYQDIEDKEPDLVLDLHEAIIYNDSRDFLGSTLIFTELEGMEEMFFDMLFATQDGSLCSNEFGYTGPGPNGSINATVTKQLGIPTITVETFRGFSMERRVGDQLDIVQYVLQYLDMR